MSRKTDLSSFNNDWYDPGGGRVKRMLWYMTNAVFFQSALPFSGLKIFLLRLYGASVGAGVVIKPGVNIKYPWNLVVGDHVWIGEKVWIDNLGKVELGDHSCISQGAMLLCGNHDYRKSTFNLIVGNITIRNGGWVGAQSVVCPGVFIGEHAILSVGSVATRDLEPYSIYQGNPAVKIRERLITE